MGACEIRHPAKMIKLLQMFTPRCLSHASAGEATFAGPLGGKSAATQEYRSPQRGAQVAVLLLETFWLPARAPGLSVLIDTPVKWSNSTAKSGPVPCTNTSAAFELVPRARGIKQVSSNPWLSVPRIWADLPPWAKEQGTGCRKQGRERCVPPPKDVLISPTWCKAPRAAAHVVFSRRQPPGSSLTCRTAESKFISQLRRLGSNYWR